MIEINKIYNEDCLELMKRIDDNSVDCIVTDPPYGYSFMGKDWDKVVPSVEIWKECFRVMKHGSFAFIMSAPRQDVLSHMIVNLDKAGFDTSFTSIYWTYASGFPKALSISKSIDKRGGKYLGWFIDYILEVAKKKGITNKQLSDLFPSKNGNPTGWLWNKKNTQGITLEQYNKIKDYLQLPFDTIEEAEREVIGKKSSGLGSGKTYAFTDNNAINEVDVTIPKTEEAKTLDGSYAGFQPKPAVEIIIVVMKPLSEKTYIDQALKDKKGITWLDDCRVPINKDIDDMKRIVDRKPRESGEWKDGSGYKNETNIYTGVPEEGRFPANLIVSDDVLNDGKVYAGQQGDVTGNEDSKFERGNTHGDYSGIGNPMKPRNDEGSFSRYYDVDKWWEERIKALPENIRKVFPFLITPKAAKSEKNFGCEGMIEKQTIGGGGVTSPLNDDGSIIVSGDKGCAGKYGSAKAKATNNHPTVKPLKLMSYLITLGSRESDIIYDPFSGSGTTLISAQLLGRKFIGSEISEEYFNIAEKRLHPFTSQTSLF